MVTPLQSTVRFRGHLITSTNKGFLCWNFHYHLIAQLFQDNLAFLYRNKGNKGDGRHSKPVFICLHRSLGNRGGVRDASQATGVWSHLSSISCFMWYKVPMFWYMLGHMLRREYATKKTYRIVHTHSDVSTLTLLPSYRQHDWQSSYIFHNHQVSSNSYLFCLTAAQGTIP